MEQNQIQQITAVMDYIEAHLINRLELNRIAQATHYSKYHLHRMFTNTLGVPLHNYIQRRRLTEAAKLLVCSDKSILEIALLSGYESQQAFTGAFKAMYKRTPLEYREGQVFYPLQLAFSLNSKPSALEALVLKVTPATVEDIPAWMDFVSLVIDGFPGLDRAEHRERLCRHIGQKQAFLMRDRDLVIGAAACSPGAGNIDFLAIHPQYRKYAIAQTFLDYFLCHVFSDRDISITTFREGDRADTGQRAAYLSLGFAEAELLTEFGYPTQRLVLDSKSSILKAPRNI